MTLDEALQRIAELEREVAGYRARRACIHCLGAVEENGKCKNEHCIGSEFSYENPDGWPKKLTPCWRCTEPTGRGEKCPRCGAYNGEGK